jgi:cold shock CspA family protein
MTMHGKMIWFNGEKGYGFIQTDDDERLHVASNGFLPNEEPKPESRCAGRAVTFERIADDGTARAVNVAFVPVGELPNRARLRSPRSGSKL